LGLGVSKEYTNKFSSPTNRPHIYLVGEIRKDNAMKVSKLKAGTYTPKHRGDEREFVNGFYLVENAPAVLDVEKGGTWLFTMGEEDTLQLLDVSEKQAQEFPSDEAYDSFVEARQVVCLNHDHTANGGKVPRDNPVARAAAMFGLAEDPDLMEACGWPKEDPAAVQDKPTFKTSDGVKTGARAAYEAAQVKAAPVKVQAKSREEAR
jgi:hypothetical protein